MDLLTKICGIVIAGSLVIIAFRPVLGPTPVQGAVSPGNNLAEIVPLGLGQNALLLMDRVNGNIWGYDLRTGEEKNLGQLEELGKPIKKPPAIARQLTDAEVKDACVRNLKQIDGAVQQWALENKKSPNSTYQLTDLMDYFRGRIVPACPAGGTYRPGASVGGRPTCTVPGHELK